MSRHKFTVVVEVDDEALAKVTGDTIAPSVDDWWGADLARALEMDLAAIESATHVIKLESLI